MGETSGILINAHHNKHCAAHSFVDVDFLQEQSTHQVEEQEQLKVNRLPYQMASGIRLHDRLLHLLTQCL